MRNDFFIILMIIKGIQSFWSAPTPLTRSPWSYCCLVPRAMAKRFLHDGWPQQWWARTTCSRWLVDNCGMMPISLGLDWVDPCLVSTPAMDSCHASCDSVSSAGALCSWTSLRRGTRATAIRKRREKNIGMLATTVHLTPTTCLQSSISRQKRSWKSQAG